MNRVLVSSLALAAFWGGFSEAEDTNPRYRPRSTRKLEDHAFTRRSSYSGHHPSFGSQMDDFYGDSGDEGFFGLSDFEDGSTGNGIAWGEPETEVREPVFRRDREEQETRVAEDVLDQYFGRKPNKIPSRGKQARRGGYRKVIKQAQKKTNFEDKRKRGQYVYKHKHEVESKIPRTVEKMVSDSKRKVLAKVYESTQRQDGGSDGMWRTFVSTMTTNFSPQVVTGHLVANWLTVFATTIAWIAVGSMYNGSGLTLTEGRSGELKQEEEEPFWKSILPEKEDIALLLREVADVTERWNHDEL